MASTAEQQSEMQITCPRCEGSMTHLKRMRFERDRNYDIEQLKCEQCGFEMPNLIDKNSK